MHTQPQPATRLVGYFQLLKFIVKQRKYQKDQCRKDYQINIQLTYYV